MLTWLSYERAKKCGWTDRQTAFQLYIIDSDMQYEMFYKLPIMIITHQIPNMTGFGKTRQLLTKIII